MATVPIEIILQDAEAPVDPTPTPEEETNIVVPDTGAGTVGSGSTLTGSSAATIILPAILLVMALATVCTVLVHKRRKRQDNDNFSKKEKLLTATSTTIAVLSATVLVGNLVIPATNAATSVEPGTADLDVADKITITATREADSGEVVATVQNTSYATANLDFGYKVTASMAEGTTTANLYLDGNTDSPYYIASVVDGTLTDNTWGYTLDEEAEEYLAIPLADTPAIVAKGNDTIVENKPVDIYYTIKADKSLPAGTYTGEIKYSISEQDPIDSLTYMQDFSTLTAEKKALVIASMPKGEQYTLKDKRDEKSYYISRLADGNVWMTQNLDFDLDKDTVLTPTDTNVLEDWRSFRSTASELFENDETGPYSRDPGEVYYYTSDNNNPDTVYNSLEDCEREHNDGTCPHYHAGNYYNWVAAVALDDMAQSLEEYTKIDTSICPAGWELPEGPNAEDRHYGEMANMVKSYNGILEEEITIGCGGHCGAYYAYLSGGFSASRVSPIWLARSGDGTLDDVGQIGKYWTNTAAYTTIINRQAYYLSFSSDNIYPAKYDSRGSGFSIRCIAQ